MKKLLLYTILLLIIACNSDNVIPVTNVEEIPTEEETLPEEEEEEVPVEEVLLPEEVFPAGSLNSFFSNSLISDRSSNIDRKYPIQITEYDQVNNRIKTNYSYLENLLVQGTNNQSWFVTQNGEASTVVEIVSVNTTEGWISLGNTYLGSLNTRIGATLEFFNPFVNYEIINDRPIFSPYPTVASEENLHYIQPGGIIEKSDGTYILLTPVVFGPHTKRSIYYASSTNLEDWTFHDDLVLETMTIPFAIANGNVFSTGNPFRLEDGSLLVLLGVQQPNNNYTSAYMILDEDLNILQQPTEIMIPEWNGLDQNSFPLAITKFNNEYRILFHRRNPSFIDREIHEIVASNLLDALNFNQSIISSNIIHKGNTSSGYLRGKADDAAYLEFNSELYILLGGEELGSTYLTSRNREYGLVKWNGGSWDHDSRSPLLVNPVQLHNKYPEYDWAWDHLGAFVSPIIKNNTLYVFMAFGTDNPDYFISGIKVSLN
ncbi:hypothetical protein MWU78_15750 [Arenibacter sp. F26102]|uniref:hypothetical protein n=1 Tax=Arenibacter sp. F26102 TaxID=2926416 RepID=UPI001FF30332|nr:hypothetical protein [Arenibacter sp. F26102]MCK0147111.1 hypothetical protein [Arenibacter sp. F26102]